MHEVLSVLAGVSVTPDPAGLPGGAAAQKMVDGLAFYTLLAGAAAILFGGASWFLGDQRGNFSAATGGRRAVLAGVVAAVLAGAAAAIVNFFYAVGSGVR